MPLSPPYFDSLFATWDDPWRDDFLLDVWIRQGQSAGRAEGLT
jgi:hypothetical protein